MLTEENERLADAAKFAFSQLWPRRNIKGVLDNSREFRRVNRAILRHQLQVIRENTLPWYHVVTSDV